MKEVLAVTRKELRQIGRDRRTLLILLFVPAFFLLLYGYALNWDIRHVRLALEDNDRSSQSRALVSAFVNSGYFDLVASVTSPADITRLIDRNEARAVLVIPAGFGRDALARHPTAVQVLINGDNANTATTVMAYAQAIVRDLSVQYERRGVSLRAAGPPLVVEPRIWYNPQLRSTLFLLPGLIAFIAMITAVVSTSLSVVREKESGTMEQVRMSPIGTTAYIIGKTIPYFVIGLASSMGTIVSAMLLFDLPMRGSWLVLLLAVSVFLVGALALGLFISTIAETQQIAFQIAMLASFLPTLLLSGFIFPIASMPAALQVITRVVPARYFLVALRAIVLKGSDVMLFWRELLALAIFAVLMLAFASIRLRRQWTYGGS